MLINQVLVEFPVESEKLLLIVIRNVRDIYWMLPPRNHLDNLLGFNSLNALGEGLGWEPHGIFKQMIVLSCLIVVLHLDLSVGLLNSWVWLEKWVSELRHLFYTHLKTGFVCLLAILCLLKLAIATGGVHVIGAEALMRVHCVFHVVSFGWLPFGFLSLIKIQLVWLYYNHFSLVVRINLWAFIKRVRAVSIIGRI